MSMSMSAPQRVCIMLGGTGRALPLELPTRKICALCAAFVRPSGYVVVPLPRPLPLAA